MSISRLQLSIQGLPYNLREQVIGYARAVDAAAPEIARDASVTLTAAARDELVFLAGIRKLYAICAASYWAIDNAGAFLQQRDITTVFVGRTNYSRGGALHFHLRLLLREFDDLLQRYGLVGIDHTSYPELLVRITNER